MIRAIPSCMLYTLIIHMDASFVYRGCEPTLLYIGGFYFSTLGNASAYPVHPVSDGGLKNFSFIVNSILHQMRFFILLLFCTPFWICGIPSVLLKYSTSLSNPQLLFYIYDHCTVFLKHEQVKATICQSRFVIFRQFASFYSNPAQFVKSKL